MRKPINFTQEEMNELHRLQSLSPFDLMKNWIIERDRVRIAKLANKLAPWTKDPVIRHFRFCNVKRIDDKVSDWLMQNWYLPNHNHKNIVIACVMARQFNRIETLQELGFPTVWNADKTHKILLRRVEQKLPCYSMAYVVTGTLSREKKPHQSVYSVIDVIHKAKKPLDPTSMRETANTLMTYRGFSTFTAGQVVADLRWAMAGSWEDRNSWAPIGPGSRRGMNRLHGRDLLSPMRQGEFGAGTRRTSGVARVTSDGTP